MAVIDNDEYSLKEDLSNEIKGGSKISIIASTFSIYAYEALRAELEKIDELRFIFSSAEFIADKKDKDLKEFYIPKIKRENGLYGTEFEIKLKNELTQKAIAKECAEWIKKKVRFKSNFSNRTIQGGVCVDDVAYDPVESFTAESLGCVKGNSISARIHKDNVKTTNLLRDFESVWDDKNLTCDVTDVVLSRICSAYRENSPEFLYFVTLYNIFKEFLDDITDDDLPNESTGFKNSLIWNKLYPFQKDACIGIINKLEKYNGCILADSVGLGKTFTALGVIKYYESRNRNVLVLCPKKLESNWNTFRNNYINNPILGDRLGYHLLFHTDLSRRKGSSNGIDLSLCNWGNYDLVVIDESHSFRNGGNNDGSDTDDDKINRYATLMNKVMRAGVRTKVLMLSATPVNNRFNDLKNQLALAYEGNSELINEKLNVNKSIDSIFKNAQFQFNKWNKLDIKEKTTENLLSMLDIDFFHLLDDVTIARSRKHIQKYYNNNQDLTFPNRLKPKSLRPKLTDIKNAITYDEVFATINKLNLSIYTPTYFILPSKISKYADLFEDNTLNIGITQGNRERGIRKLMAINLLKRMESSVNSFKLTISRIKELIDNTINKIEKVDQFTIDPDLFKDFDDDDLEISEAFSVGKKIDIDIRDMDYMSWKCDLVKDSEVLSYLIDKVSVITPEHDCKLYELLDEISKKIDKPLNDSNKKVLIFTAFKDTAEYLYKNVSEFVKNKFNLNTALISGSGNGRTTCKSIDNDFNSVLTCFSPISKERDVLDNISKENIDILIATDCISEGQNLQDCDYLVNYDIHWNPVRIIQRFGRIDRIGSKNKDIQMVNFWPDVTLDEYINLKARVESRMKLVDMTATGDDNLLDADEQKDLEYRKEKLKRLQDEVVDLEEMSGGISIVDLGLNDFRLELLNYIDENPDIKKAPTGLSCVIESRKDNPSGVIFVLRNRNNGINIDKKNLLHPFYLVYISDQGEIVCDHLKSKNILDSLRLFCKDNAEPNLSLCEKFNLDTKDGRDMSTYSSLLNDAIASIVDIKESCDVDGFLAGDKVSFLEDKIEGIEDFELISFFVVR